MVRLFTDAELAEKCALHRPIPLYLQKAILDPPKSIRNNVYKDIHRTYQPNYQAPVSVIDMALNAQTLYGVSARSYVGVYNKLVDKEKKTNRKELDRDLEELPVEEDALGYYYDKHGGIHETLEDYMIRQEKAHEMDIRSKGIRGSTFGSNPDTIFDAMRGYFIPKKQTITLVENIQPDVLDYIDYIDDESEDQKY